MRHGHVLLTWFTKASNAVKKRCPRPLASSTSRDADISWTNFSTHSPDVCGIPSTEGRRSCWVPAAEHEASSGCCCNPEVDSSRNRMSPSLLIAASISLLQSDSTVITAYIVEAKRVLVWKSGQGFTQHLKIRTWGSIVGNNDSKSVSTDGETNCACPSAWKRAPLCLLFKGLSLRVKSESSLARLHLRDIILDWHPFRFYGQLTVHMCSFEWVENYK